MDFYRVLRLSDKYHQSLPATMSPTACAVWQVTSEATGSNERRLGANIITLH